MKLRKKQYADAINSLEGVEPNEKGQLTGNLSDSCIIPAYLRSETALGAGNASQALAEFQKFSTSTGIVGSCWSVPLAKLGTARASDVRINKPGERSLRKIPRSVEGRGCGDPHAQAGKGRSRQVPLKRNSPGSSLTRRAVQHRDRGTSRAYATGGVALSSATSSGPA